MKILSGKVYSAQVHSPIDLVCVAVLSLSTQRKENLHCEKDPNKNPQLLSTLMHDSTDGGLTTTPTKATIHYLNSL